MTYKKLFFSLLAILILGSVAYGQISLVASSGNIQTRTLWWVDKNGNETKIKAPSNAYYFPKISSDGKKVVLTAMLKGVRNIHILDLDKGTAKAVTSDLVKHQNQPIWSPDGKHIAYASADTKTLNAFGGKSEIFYKAEAGNGEPVNLVTSPGEWNFPYTWKKDGTAILTAEGGPNFNNFDIGMILLDGSSSKYVPLMNKEYHENQPQLSPDNKWLAYCTDESGKMQVYVSPFPEVDKGKWKISTEEGNSPRWSPDGNELYYLTGTRIIEAVMVVKVETTPAFSSGKPEVLFRGGLYLGSMPANGIPYDVHPDGQRLLMMKEF